MVVLLHIFLAVFAVCSYIKPVQDEAAVPKYNNVTIIYEGQNAHLKMNKDTAFSFCHFGKWRKGEAGPDPFIMRVNAMNEVTFMDPSYKFEFEGNLTAGQAYFTLKQARVNDSGIYCVYCGMSNGPRRHIKELIVKELCPRTNNTASGPTSTVTSNLSASTSKTTTDKSMPANSSVFPTPTLDVPTGNKSANTSASPQPGKTDENPPNGSTPVLYGAIAAVVGGVLLIVIGILLLLCCLKNARRNGAINNYGKAIKLKNMANQGQQSGRSSPNLDCVTSPDNILPAV